MMGTTMTCVPLLPCLKIHKRATARRPQKAQSCTAKAWAASFSVAKYSHRDMKSYTLSTAKAWAASSASHTFVKHILG